MACVCAAAERCLHVRAVVRVNIRRIVDSVCFCCRNQLAGKIVAVRAAAVFDADGYLMLFTLQSVADTAISTERISVTPSGTEADPPWPTSSYTVMCW